ncbi:cohesin domain-containing protein [Methanolobus sp. ZRKC5]
MKFGKGDNVEVHDVKVHRLYCYYDDQKTGGKASCGLHQFELNEEKVKEIFTRGEKDECRSITPDWMGGWSKTLESTDDRFVMLCGRPGLNPDDAGFHEIVGNIRYRRSVINIRVKSQGSEDIVKSVFCALEKNAKAVIDGNDCQEWCSKVNEHFIWDGKSEWPECQCVCEQGYGKKDDECVKCEDWCQKMDSRAHYDPKESKPDECECYCTGNLLEFEWGIDTGKCECVPGAVPKGNECECPEGWNLSVWGDKCIKEEKAVVEKTPIEVERERIANQYNKLEKGYLLFSEGTVSKTSTYVPGMPYHKYGHVGIYIGDYEVPAGKNYTVRDSAAAPLKIYRKDPKTGIYQPIKLKLGEKIKPGDLIIGAVVEMRLSGAVFTTVDGMKRESYNTMGGYDTIKRWPYFDWKTTKPAPTPEQVDKICQFVLKKVELTEQGKLGYWPGKMGTMVGGKERWDCGCLGMGAYRYAKVGPTLNYKKWLLLPMEIYNNVDAQYPRSPRDILTTVRSPVNLHLYDGEGRHVGMTTQGIVEMEIPNAYYQPEIEEYHQGILIRNVNDDYQLTIKALDEGSFSLHILDHNVCNSGSITEIDFQEVSIIKDTKATLNLGSVNNEYLMRIDEDDDGKVDKMLEPTLLTTTLLTMEKAVESIGLTFESRSKPSGSSVQIPLTLNDIEENIGNMDITLAYDSSALEATEVIKGGLTTDSLFDYNIMDETIKISLADKNGFSGDGSIAYIDFNVIGAEGTSSDLEIVAITANRADDYEAVEIQIHDGLFSVISIEAGMGDGDGDGVYTSLDALYALQMAVEKIPKDPVMDVNGDGTVTSFDARTILKNVVGEE